MHLRIATCRPLPEPDVDEDLLLGALRARGVEARMAAWNDPSEPWDAAVPTVLRSTWDYIHDLPAFSSWIERVERAAPLWNAGDLVHWNAHKGYLAELERAGHAVVPTEFLPRGASARLTELSAARGWRDVVVKPTVSAGSFGTRRFRADARGDEGFEAGQRFLDDSTAARDVLVQRYVDSVDDYGERSLVWIDGEFTHAIRKTPRFSGQDESVSDAITIADDERALASAVLATVARVSGARRAAASIDAASRGPRAPSVPRLLYARVDLARDASGRPMVMEVELIEPSLFLKQSPAALERFVGAILRRLSSATSSDARG